MTTSTAVVAVVPAIVSEATADTLTSALRSLHGVVAAYDGAALPTFTDCSDEEYQTICIRAINALIRRRKALRLAALDGVRAKVQGVLDTHLAAQRVLKSQYDAVPAAIRPMLPPFPMQLAVPLADIVGCFPAGEAEGTIVKSLHDMSFTVSKPDLRTKTKHAYTVIFPFTEAPETAENETDENEMDENEMDENESYESYAESACAAREEELAHGGRDYDYPAESFRPEY